MKYVKSEHFIIFYVFLLIRLFKIVHSVPIDYCLQPLNKSDCKVEPTPVFSYYKPGSRCEIEMWRGCPTMNKFDNEYECSHFCIAKMFKFQDANENVLSVTASVEMKEPPADPCTAELNTTQCTQTSTEVYTYNNGTCEKVIWRGCDTLNKFDNETACQETCVKENIQEWKGKLQQLSHLEVKEIDDILDDIVNETTTLNINEEVTTALINDDMEAPTTHVVAEETTAVLTTEVSVSETTILETTTVTPEPTEEIPGDADEVILT